MTPFSIYTALLEYRFQHRHDQAAPWEDFTAQQERRSRQAQRPPWLMRWRRARVGPRGPSQKPHA